MQFKPTRTKHKVMLALYATLALLCTVVIVVAHFGERRAQQEQSAQRLGTIVSTVSEQLSSSNVLSLLDRYRSPGLVIKNTQDAWYYVLHERLNKATVRNGLTTPLEIVHYDSSSTQLQVIVTAADKPRFRSAWQGDPTWLLSHYGSSGSGKMGGAGSTELIAYEPMRDSEGRTVGMLIARAPTELATAAALSSLIRNIGIAVVLFGIAGFLLFRYVGRWLQEEEHSHEKLQERHDHITDSIAYAGKIQRAMVPSALLYDELFDDSFIIDRPKDVVSGDFHWVHRIDANTCYVAAADCTGHGLPGAMIAAIGCSLLNEIVPMHADKDPAAILGILHKRMVAALHQQGKQRGAGDGMDLALCRVDRQHNELLFAGAYRPLYWSHQGQLSVINGDRRPIGGGHYDEARKFTSHRLAFTRGDRIYLFSDGYVDQFGGPDKERFMTTRLRSMIQQHQHLPLKEQAIVFDRTFLEWKGAADQMDDVSMLGLAV